MMSNAELDLLGGLATAAAVAIAAYSVVTHFTQKSVARKMEYALALSLGVDIPQNPHELLMRASRLFAARGWLTVTAALRDAADGVQPKMRRLLMRDEAESILVRHATHTWRDKARLDGPPSIFDLDDAIGFCGRARVARVLIGAAASDLPWQRLWHARRGCDAGEPRAGGFKETDCACPACLDDRQTGRSAREIEIEAWERHEADRVAGTLHACRCPACHRATRDGLDPSLDAG